MAYTTLQKILDGLEARIIAAFKEQTGFDAVEIGEAFPVSRSVTVHTETRTFHGWLTPTGRVKKGSFIEEC